MNKHEPFMIHHQILMRKKANQMQYEFLDYSFKHNSKQYESAYSKAFPHNPRIKTPNQLSIKQIVTLNHQLVTTQVNQYQKLLNNIHQQSWYK